jgi:hypothetical protein
MWAASAPTQATAQRFTDAEIFGLTIGAALTEITLHETGHAVMAASLGWEIHKFAPYPHMCGGKFVGGCVMTSTDEEADSPDYDSEQAWVSASGSIASTLSALALAPFVNDIQDPYGREYARQVVFYQRFDFPFYVLYDLLGFDGDWQSVADHTGVSLWWFVPLAAAHVYGMQVYVDKFGL